MLQVIADIIERESEEYTNDPNDRGGPTKYGITLRTLFKYRKEECTASDVENLEKPEAITIYEQMYIVWPRFNELTNTELMEYVVDCGVLHGCHRTIKWLQETMGGLQIDGLLGPISIQAINHCEMHRGILFRLIAIRCQKIADFVQSYPSQLEYLEGWIVRATYPLTQEDLYI